MNGAKKKTNGKPPNRQNTIISKEPF